MRMLIVLMGLITIFAENVLADHAYRDQYGAANTIWMHGLIEDYTDGTITEADLLRELWAERPDLMAVLWDFYAGDFNECFRLDLIAAESNAVKFIDDGWRVFHDTSIYLDSLGEVIPGQEGAYNNAVRANSILNDVYDENQPICQNPPLNHQCCYEKATGGTECHDENNKRCHSTGPNVLNCTQSQGNPCS